jgi:SAM-dependent methyltransferase
VAGVEDKWDRPGAGEHYERRRFRSARASSRDPRLVERILDDHGVHGALLDVPCGAGRLGPLLASRGGPVVGVDVSHSMLTAAPSPEMLVQAAAQRLPFAARSFDVVVCCRLLHHLRTREERLAVVRELVRVSSRLVLASFWDSGSLPAWRVRLGLKESEGPRGRSAVSRATVAGELGELGLEVLGFRHSLRFVSQQTFVVGRHRSGT